MYEILVTGEYKTVKFQIVRNDENNDYGWCTDLNKEAFGNNYTAYNWFNYNPENCLQGVRHVVDNLIKSRSTNNNTIDIKACTYVILKLKAMAEPVAGKVIAVNRSKRVFCLRKCGEDPQIFDFNDVESVDAEVRPYFYDEFNELIGRDFIRRCDNQHFKAVGCTDYNLVLLSRRDPGYCDEYNCDELADLFVMTSKDNAGLVPVLKHIG